MSRFARVDNQPNYSDLKPERFDAELPKGLSLERPQDLKTIRELRDNPPTPEEERAEARRPPYANRGHANLKGRL